MDYIQEMRDAVAYVSRHVVFDDADIACVDCGRRLYPDCDVSAVSIAGCARQHRLGYHDY